MKRSLEIINSKPLAQLLWATHQELLNIFQANEISCHIITTTNDLLAKLNLVEKNQEDSLHTIKMFFNDAKRAGYNV